MKYSVSMYKKLCRIVAEEQTVLKKKEEFIEQMNFLGLKSTSIIQVCENPSYSANATERKLFLLEEYLKEARDSEVIIDCALKSTALIDYRYRDLFVQTYLLKDRNGKKRYPIHTAEEYGLDRRRFTKELDTALEKAMESEEMTALLNRIRDIAARNGREEYLNVFRRE